jgi:hypothetical protein
LRRGGAEQEVDAFRVFREEFFRRLVAEFEEFVFLRFGGLAGLGGSRDRPREGKSLHPST